MIKQFHANGYFFRNKIHEIVTSTGRGIAEDKKLESYEKEISILLAGMVAKKFKPAKKSVYFVTFEADWLESGSFKNETEFTCVPMSMTPKEFGTLNTKNAKADARALAKK